MGGTLALGAPSLVHLLERNAQDHPDGCAVRASTGGRWADVSWSALAARVRALSDGLVGLGLEPGDRVGLLADTRLDHVLLDLAILAARAIPVPIYTTELGPYCARVLRSTGARWIFCDTPARVEKIRGLRAEIPGLAGILRLEGEPRDGFERTLDDLERGGAARHAASGRAFAERLAAIGPEDVASIIHTSGTTGEPKGAAHTHQSWLYTAAAYEHAGVVRPGAGDVALLFLPLAHAMGWMILSGWLRAPWVLAVARSIETVLEDAAATRPTLLAGPPRLFEKAYAGMMARGSATPGLQGRLFRLAVRGAEAHLEARARPRLAARLGLALGRSLVFPRLGGLLAERFGGRLEIVVSGSAPLAPRIIGFLELLGMPILQGYGLTETTGAGCCTRPDHRHPGTVGPPLLGTEVRLAPDGEILLRSPGLMRGYWGDPEATAAALQDGWLQTGDVGELETDGCLRITDRKKDLLKTAGGKFVAPLQLESLLRADALIANAMAYGDGRPFVTALVTLNRENLERWATASGLTLGARPAEHPAVRARIQEAVDRVNAHLPRYATIKRFAIAPEDFDVASGTLTATLKVKRRKCAERYQALLDGLYAGS